MMEGGGGGRECVLCCAPHNNTVPLLKICDKDVLNSVFVLHKVLPFTLMECSTFLEEENLSSSFCTICTKLLNEGLSIAKGIDVLQKRLCSVQTKLRQQMNRQREPDLRVKLREKMMGEGGGGGGGIEIDIVDGSSNINNEIGVGPSTMENGSQDEAPTHDHEVSSASGIGIISSISSGSKSSSVTGSNSTSSTMNLSSASGSIQEQCEIQGEGDANPLQIEYEEYNYEVDVGEQNVDVKEGVRVQEVQNDDYEMEDFTEGNGSVETIPVEEGGSGRRQSDQSGSSYSSRPQRQIRTPSKLVESMETCDEDDDDYEEEDEEDEDDCFPSPPTVRFRKSNSSSSSSSTRRCKNKQNQYVCLFCDIKFGNSIKLGDHYSTMHPETKESGWACNACPSTFSGRKSLYKHRMLVHKNLPSQIYVRTKTKNGRQEENEPPRLKRSVTSKLTCVPNTKVYVCVLCDLTSLSPRELGNHYNTEHPNPNWACPTCHINYPCKDDLYHHRKRTHDNFPPKPQPKVVADDENKEEDVKPPMPSLSPQIEITPSFQAFASSSGSTSASSFPETVSNPSPSPSKKKEISFDCLSCAMKFKNGKDLNLHYQQDHPSSSNSTWQCPECPKCYNSNGALYIHQRRKHLGKSTKKKKNKTKKSNPTSLSKQKRMCMCLLCDEVYSTTYTLNDHYKAEHPNTTIWKCRKCDKQFDAKKGLYYHRKHVHMDLLWNKQYEDGGVSLIKGIQKKQRKKPSRNSYQCLLCDEMFNGAISLGNHYKTIHSNNKNWNCNACEAEFQEKWRLYLHRKTVHQNLECNKKRKIIQNLRKKKSKPEIIPSENVPPVVTSSATSSSSYSPTKKLPYVCLLCDVVRDTKVDLQRHYKDVHGPKITRWKCFTCGKDYEKRSHLYQHRLQIHRNLPASLNLKPRKKKVRKFDCVICGVDCNSAAGVAKHYKVAHPTLSKSLNCAICKKVFSTYNSLFSHKRHYHKINPNPQSDLIIKREPGSESTPNPPLLKVPKFKKRQYKCGLCGSECHSAKGVFKHYQEIHPQFKYGECYLCGKAFGNNSHLYFHIKKFHRGADKPPAAETRKEQNEEGVVVDVEVEEQPIRVSVEYQNGIEVLTIE